MRLATTSFKKLFREVKFYMAKESRYWKDWLDKAEKDLQRVEKRLKDGDIEDAAFHLQQAIEKYLKGYYTVGTTKKTIFGTRKREKSGVLLTRKTYIMLEMCIE